MDNKNKIGCRFGSGSKGDRTKIIDPNLFGNETNSSRNIPVNLDDLTISVKLTTRKKGRTVLSTDNSENNSSVKEQKDVKINFIDGTDINGKNVLTTKYTQLTTVFDKDTFNPETFGITNIDIDFNSSYVPMIKINFVDVKGSSIFQNEEEILDNNTSNKYAVFFEFPYPLFELEIKGYYGQPVTYCLHLLKFNTKFNPDSGNFEITCEFMGYTYALLADMLVGFLRVIPFTDIGKEKFELYNEGKGEDEKILNLVDLKDKIDRISDAIQKTAKKSEEAKLSNTFTEAISILNQLEINFNNLQNFSKDDGAFTRNIVYNFVIMNDTSFTPEQNKNYNLTKEAITENITKFNNLNIEGVTLDVTKVKIPIKLTNLTKNKLLPEINLVFSSVSDIESFKSDLLNFLDKTFAIELNSELPFSVFDLREIYKIINEQKQKLDEELKNSKKNLAERIKENVIKNLGFDPTVRNMVEVFTSLIEVFIETIYEVSVKAESEIKRKELFKQVFKNNEAGDYNREDIDIFNYYPWPSYRERKNANEGFVDKYLGDNDIIKNNISDVPELVFIENLLNAFLLAKRREDTLAETNPETAVAYIPISPLDTKLFDSNGNPYSRIELINPQQIYRLALIRAMIFMGYTNDENFLTQEEILKMSELEAMSLLDGLKNPKLKVAISNITKNDIINSIGKINFDDSEKIIKKVGSDYVYDYLYKDLNIKLLPLNSDLTQKRVPGPTSALALKEFQEDGNLFLTNYSSGIHNDLKVSKFDDGGIYVKFFTKNEFEEDIIPLIETVATDNLINLPALKATELNPQTIGFNSFAGSYGIQEFVNLDTGDENIKTIPLKYIFYSTTSNFEYSITRTINSNIEKGFDIKSAKAYDKYKYGKNKKISGYKKYYENKAITFYEIILFNNKSLLHGSNVNLYRLINEDRNKLTYPYIEYRARTITGTNSQEPFSLFGSSWYYLQEDAKITKLDNTTVSAENYVKGLLFLNTIPFNNDRDVDNYSDPFYKKEITRLFNIKGGFIHVPRLWAAYIGGLLWWLSDDEPDIVNGLIVGGGRGQKDPVVWKWACDLAMDNDYIPKTSSPTPYSDRQLFPKTLDTSRTTKVIESVIDGLPEQVRDEFKKVFFDFINNTDDDLLNFNFLKENLEIKKGTNQNFCTFLKRLKPDDPNTLEKKDTNKQEFYETSDFDIYLKNLDNYSVVLPIDYNGITKEWLDWSVFLELKDNTDVTKRLVDSLLDEELIIANTGYAIWDLTNRKNTPGIRGSFSSLRKDIKVNENNFDLYFDNFVSFINDSLSGSTLQNEEEKELNSIFGISNKSDIKLMLYRHCKNIYDKWLGGVTDPSNVIFQCGDNTREGSNRNTIDLELAKKYNRTKPRLIDSFRFVTRSFRDIGDELFVNPKPINDSLTNSNVSAYSVISVLLNDNKFNFIPLPTFINYRDEETLQNVFNPIQYSETVGSCGPTFVCVYVGQSSNSLDIKSGKYPNDGFDFRCDSPSSMPSDFNSELREGEDPVSVFSVNYSQQNQNIFKSISLDQSEYSETEESLKIVEDISMQGFENKPTPGGQNLYNVYAVRSYNAEVEMLGNAMIQPMMYFQLNNIPMFHGAYMITRVKHNIQPNHMSTTFTGVRIRAVESPIIDIADAFMNLIDTLDLSEAGTSTRASVGGKTPNSSSPIIQTLINNGVTGGNVNNGNIKLCSIGKIKGVSFKFNPDKQMICEAVEPITKMLTDWANWMESQQFKPLEIVGSEKIFVYVTSVYRAQNSNSTHAFGIAIDLQMGDKSGVVIPNNAGTDSNGDKKRFSLPEYFNFVKNPALKWLYNNSYKYGFVQPYWANEGKGSGNDSEEHWHWEYHGKSAICMLRKQPIPGLGNNKLSDNPLSEIEETNIFNFVKNPLEPDGKEAIYNDCEYKTTNLVTDKTNNISEDLSTTNNNKNVIKNQKQVKDFLKNQGLTKEQVAGIMGNIHKETGGTFDPLSVNKKDSNGFPSVGLIQWNGRSTPSNGSKDAKVILNSVGKTINEQLIYLTTKTFGYSKWLNLPEKNKTKTSPYLAAYEFARLVERCAGCTDDLQSYKNNTKLKPFERSLFANDYFNRFNNQQDELFW